MKTLRCTLSATINALTTTTTKLLKTLLAVSLFMLMAQQTFAASGITYTGRILDSNNAPVVSSDVKFTVTVYDALGQCWLYTEQRQLDLSNSAGTFSFDIGSNDSSLVASSASFNGSTTGPQNLSDVFSNTKSFSGLGAANSCSGTYTPNPSDLTAGRVLAIFFSVAGGPAQALPTLKLNPVPSAQTVGGYGTGELLRVGGSVTRGTNTNNDLNQAQYDEFWRLIKNPLLAYLPTTGDVTVSGANNKVTTLLTKTLPAAAPTTAGQVLAYDGTNWAYQTLGTGSVTSVTATAPVVAGGTASAPVISMPKSTAAVDGYLDKGDFAIFAAKQSSALADGKIWVGNASGVAAEVTMTGDASIINTGAITLKNTGTAGTYGSASLIPVVTTDAQGRVTGVTTIAPVDATKLPLAGGTMTGDITMDNQKGTLYRELTVNGTNSAKIQAPASLAADYTLTLPVDDGTASHFLQTDGSGNLTWASPSASLPGLANGLLWIGNASGVAMPVSVTGDVSVSNAGVTSLAAIKGKTVDATAASTMGQIMYFDSAADKWKVSAAAAPADGQVLKWNDTSKAWEPAADTGGWTAVDSSYAAKGIVQFNTDAATSGVTVAAGVATVLRTSTGTSSQILSLDGSGVANAYGVGVKGATSGTAMIQAPGTFTNYSLTLPVDDGTANQVLTTDGSGILSWSSVLNAITNTATLNDAKMWIGNSSNKAMEVSMSGDATLDNAGALTLASTITAGAGKGTAQKVPQITYDAKGRLTTVTEVTIDDNTKLPLAGGTMTGPIAMGAQDLTNVGNLTMAGGKYFGLSVNATDGTVAGQMWYDGGVIKYFDGSVVKSLGVAGAGITSLNGLSGVSQTFAIGTAGNAPAFNSATTVHTLNIPMASSAGTVTAGLLSNAEYVALNAKQSTTLADGKVWIGNASNASEAQSLSGDVTITNAGVATVDKTQAAVASKILQLTASSVAVTKGTDVGGAGAGVASIRYPNTATNTTLTLPGTAGNANEFLKTDGAGNLTWSVPAASLPALADTKVWIGNGSSVAMPVSLSGDVASITNAGAVTVDKTATGTASKILALDGSSVANMKGAGIMGATSGTAIIQAPATFTNYSLTLPVDDGAANQVLTTDGSGILSWSSVLNAITNTATLNDGKLWMGNSSNKAMEVTMSGDATMDNAGALTLKNTGTAGTYGSASLVPIVTTDAQGRVTGVTTAAPLDATKLPLAGGTMTGDITMANQKAVLFSEATGGGTNYAKIQSPAALAADYTLTLPVDDGTSGQVLSTDGSGVLAWVNSLTNSLASGKILVGNASNLTEAVDMSGDATISNTGALTLASTITAGAGKGTAQKVPQITYDAKGRLTTVTEVTIDDNTKLPLAGGTMTGPIAMGAQDITNTGNITMAANKYLGLSANSTDGAVAGQMWYDGGVIKYFDGTVVKSLGVAGAGITSLNGLSGVSQTFAIGTSGTAPAFNSATTVHTLNIPMASTATVTAGLLSKTDYDSFAAKQSTSLNSAKVWVGNASNIAAPVDLSGDATIDNAGVVTVDKSSAGAASKIVQLDASSIGTMKGLKVNGATSGTLGLYTNATTTSYDLTFPAAQGAANQVLSNNGSGVLSWASVLTGVQDSAALAGGKIWVGNASNKAMEVTLSGDITAVSNAGAVTVDKTATGTSSKILALDGSGVANAYGAGIKGATSGTALIQAPATFTNYSLTLPVDDGTANQVLATDGSGILSWATVLTGVQNSAALTDAKIWIGNASNKAMELSLSGDVTVANTGAVTIANSAVTDAKVAAGVDAAKIGGGAVSNTEYSYLDGVTSAIQTQIDAKVAKAGDSMTGDLTMANQKAVLFAEATGGGTNTAKIQAPAALAADYTLTLPVDAGSAGQVLSTNGSGVLSWAAALTNALSSGKILVGNASNLSAAVDMSGDATISNTGALTIANSAVTDAKVAAGIDAAKIGAGAVSNTEYSYLDGVTSAVQTQIDSKVAKAGDTVTGDITMDNQKGTLYREATGGGTNYAKIQAPAALAADYTLTLPTTDGAANEFLQTDGNGVLTWATPTATLPSLADTKIWVGNGSSVAMPVSLSGDITSISNAGAVVVDKTATGTASKILALDGSSVANMKGAGIMGATSGTAIIQAPATFTNYSLTLPVDDGTANQVLATDGSGILSWASVLTGVTNSATLADGKMWIGNSSGKAMDVTMSGDATITNAGVLTIANSAVTDAKVAAGVDAAKIGGGAVSNTEYSYLDGVTSAIQTQIDAKVAKAGDSMTGDLTMANQKAVLFSEATGGGTNTAKIQAPAALAADYTLTLPTSAGSSGQVLSTNGSGVLSWVAALTNGLASGKILVGNASNLSEAVDMSGDATISNTGALTIAASAITSAKINDGAIVDADVNASAAIAATKLGAGSVDNTELGYLDGVTSSIQTQFTGKVAKAGDTMTGALTMDNQMGTIYREATGGGTNAVTVRAPAALAADYTLTLPADDGTNLQFLQTDGNGNLTWAAPVATLPSLADTKIWVGNGSSVAMPVSMSGDATIDNAGAITVDKSSTGAASKIVQLDASSIGTMKGLKVNGSTSGTLGLYTNATTTSYNLTFPAAQGGSGQVLSNNGSGVLSWATPLLGVENSAPLTEGAVWVGNASGIAVGRALSGDISGVNNVGAVTVVKTTTGEGNKLLALDGSGVGTVKGAAILGATSGTVNIQAPTGAFTNYTLTLPVDDGTANQVLQSNGSGVLSWATVLTGVESTAGLAENLVWIGNASGIAVGRSLSGDVTNVNNVGAVTIDKTQAGVASKILQLDSSGVANAFGVGIKGTTTGTLNLYTNASTTSYNLTFPAAQGASGQVLANNGSGVLSWASPMTTTLADTKIWVGNGSSVAMPVSMSGDATIANTGAITLKNTGTAGTYGSASLVPIVTTDAQGRVTGVTTAAPLDATKLPLAGGNMTGNIVMDNQKAVLFSEATGGGTNYAKIQAPAALAADYTLTLPVDAGSSGQVLSTNGSGVLSWAAALTNSLSSGKIIVGNASNLTEAMTMSGDATISNTGALTIANSAVTDAKVATGIAATKIGGGAVDNTEYSYLDGVTSAIQTQFTGKVAKAGDTMTGALTMDNQMGTIYREATGGGTNSATIRAPAALAADYTLTLPTTDGSASEFLQTDGSGNLTWATPTATLPSLTSALMWVGNGSNVATAVAMSGDATIANTGALTIANSAVTDAKVATGIAATKIGGGAVDNTEYSYLDGVTSAIQTQFTGKVAKAGDSMTGDLTMANQKAVLFSEATGGGTNYAKIQAPAALAADYTLTLPVDDGTSGQALTTDGSGVLSWATVLTAVQNTATLASGKIWVGNASNKAMEVTLSGDVTAVDSAGAVTVDKTQAGVASKILQLDSSGVANAFGVGIKGTTTGTLGLYTNASTTSYNLTFPAAQGASGQVLTNNGSGVFTWSTPLTNTLADTKIWVGNGSAVAMPVSMSGDATIANTGAITLATVPVAKGGTGSTTLTSGALLVGNGTTAVATLAGGTTNNVIYATSATAWASAPPDTAGFGLVDKTNAQTNIAGAKTWTGAATFSSTVATAGTVTSSVASASTAFAAANANITAGSGGTSTAGGGQIYGGGKDAGNLAGSQIIDFNLGNIQTTSYDCGAVIRLNNMNSGGSYTVVVTGTGTTKCTFNDSGGATFADTTFAPSNTTRTASSNTIYTFVKIGARVYVSWITGFGTAN
jgi:hypothetical protein